MLFSIRLLTASHPPVPPCFRRPTSSFFGRGSKQKAVIKCRVQEAEREQAVRTLANGIDLLRFERDGQTPIIYLFIQSSGQEGWKQSSADENIGTGNKWMTKTEKN